MVKTTRCRTNRRGHSRSEIYKWSARAISKNGPRPARRRLINQPYTTFDYCSLVAASVAHPDATATPATAAQRAGEAAAVVAESVNAQVIRRASRATALWVDDRPANNVYERQSLEALGLSFVLATSTEEALDLVAKQNFDVIISDMGRPPDARAGYTLLDQLRGSGNKTPLVFYAGSNATEHKAEARKHGAIGSTNRASELFGYVLTSLKRDAYPSFKRTRSGKPTLAFISFWAKPVLPPRAAQLKR